MGEYVDYGLGVDGGVFEVLVRLFDDHFVGVWEVFGGGERRLRVTYGDLVVEERADLGDGGGEVDGFEYDHLWMGGEGVDEDVEVVVVLLAVWVVVDDVGVVLQ